MKRMAIALLAALSLLAGHAVRAQDSWPSKPIRWIIPYPPGGSTDMLARVISQKLGEALGVSVIVENKAGAGGNLGTDYVAKQEPDGYTIVMGNIGPISVNPSLYRNLPYNPGKDLAPITMLMAVPNVLVVNPDIPVQSVKELIQYAKAHSPMSFATPGAGTSLHLSGELFASSAGLNLTHVPYRGSAPALADTVGGHVPMMFDNLPSALQLIKAGKLRALAVTSSSRSPELPDVPTMAEAGLPGYEITGWFGVLAPAGTPQPIIDRLNQEFGAILQMPDVRKAIGDMGGIIDGRGPKEFGSYIVSETKKWGALVRKAHISIE